MRIGGVEAQMGQSAPSAKPNVVKAAQEFEAQMMKELLKPMTGNISCNGAEEDSGSHSALADFAVGALGQSLSRSGGLGIAKTILRSFSQTDTYHGHASIEGR